MTLRVFVVGALFAAAAFSLAPHFFAAPVSGRMIFTRDTVGTASTSDTIVAPPRVEHVATPEAVKAVYLSQCAASTQKFRELFFDLIDTTEINAVVVDIKDYSGTVAFPSEHAIPGGEGCTVPDFRELVKAFHERGVYVIGRLTVFQDPLYTSVHPTQAVQSTLGGVWRDRKGLAFVDVGAVEYWDHVVALAREAHRLGVDEINFDYIRFPSDGPMAEAVYTRTVGSKPEQLEKFFSYLHAQVAVPQDGHVPVMSADLFGMTTTNTDDLSIGQVLERTLPYFDYIAPMVYPSHYPPRFNGWPDPNKAAYGVVHFSMTEAVRRVEATTTPIAAFGLERLGTTTPALYKKPAYPGTVLRPWLQDFDYGGEYGPKEVREQIQATYDAGLTSWMLWAPSNYYTREALLAE